MTAASLEGTTKPAACGGMPRALLCKLLPHLARSLHGVQPLLPARRGYLAQHARQFRSHSKVSVAAGAPDRKQSASCICVYFLCATVYLFVGGESL